MATEKEIEQAIDNGYGSYMDGFELDENPFPYGTDLWNAWNEGFQRAKEEEEN